MKPSIFVVEDDPDISRLVRHHLEADGFAVKVFPPETRSSPSRNGSGRHSSFSTSWFPGKDGLELCRQIRQIPALAATPVIFLTAKSGEADRILGLELGADDYIPKPFSPRELVARVKAVLRRFERPLSQAPVKIGEIEIDPSAMTLIVRGKPGDHDRHRVPTARLFCPPYRPGFYPRPVARFGLARHRLRHAAFGGCLCAPHSRENRARSGKPALSEDGAGGRLPLRGPEVRRRIFFKLLAAFSLVIAAATVTFDFSVHHAWEGALLAFVVALIVSAIAAQVHGAPSAAHRAVSPTGSPPGIWRRASRNLRRDEIGQVATSLDKTARHLEESFAALQTSQRQLETLLNSMQDAVIAVSADDRVQWANQTMDKLVPQRTRKNAPLVETVRDPDFLTAVRGASEARKVFTARAASIVPGRTFDVTAAPMPGGGAVAVLRDLTETERVEKTRRDFIANVSHELRTPLTSIQGYTETLLDSAPDNNHSREFLEIIRKSALRMSRLTEDLLTLARVESGEQRFDIQPSRGGRPAAGSGAELSRNRADTECRVESRRPCCRPGGSRSRGHSSGLFESGGQCAEICRIRGADCAGGSSRLQEALNFMCRISVPAFLPNTCRGCSSASTGWTRPAPANPEEPDWDWRLPNTSCWPMAASSAPRANSITDRLSCSRFR